MLLAYKLNIYVKYKEFITFLIFFVLNFLFRNLSSISWIFICVMQNVLDRIIYIILFETIFHIFNSYAYFSYKIFLDCEYAIEKLAKSLRFSASYRWKSIHDLKRHISTAVAACSDFIRINMKNIRNKINLEMLLEKRIENHFHIIVL